jgi:hypothetical protein
MYVGEVAELPDARRRYRGVARDGIRENRDDLLL